MLGHPGYKIWTDRTASANAPDCSDVGVIIDEGKSAQMDCLNIAALKTERGFNLHLVFLTPCTQIRVPPYIQAISAIAHDDLSTLFKNHAIPFYGVRPHYKSVNIITNVLNIFQICKEAFL